MGGGLLQLVAYGAQDVYLTGNPQITFFKVIYRRHTNFSMEVIDHPLTNANFGSKSHVTITRNGDLITNTYLRVELDHVLPTVNEGVNSRFAWVRRVGHALIENVEVEIGGSKIDKHYGEWLDIWYELARHAGNGERGFLEMIGDVPELTAYNNLPKDERVLFVPLKFWFNRNCGLALPLIALQYHEVRFHFEFRRAEELIVANADFKAYDMKCVRMKNAQLLVDYIYLDSEERRRFAQVGHEYLIEQLQFTGDESVTNQQENRKLDFNHPTKELVWCVKNGNYISGHKFLAYSGVDDWEGAAAVATKSLVCASVSSADPGAGWTCVVNDDTPTPVAGANGGVWTVTNDGSGNVYVNPDTLRASNGCSIGGHVDLEIVVDSNDVLTVVSGSLSVRDLSIPVDCCVDDRITSNFVGACEQYVDDVCVYQWHNCGVLISGKHNPVQWVKIQLNGHDRFDAREGAYFNYVQPDQHHTNTPADGINVYSFALHPEQHQPSGTSNFSRIDSTKLNLTIRDPTMAPGLPDLNLLNAYSKLSVYAFSYNVLRIMSGMGGLAYAS